MTARRGRQGPEAIPLHRLSPAPGRPIPFDLSALEKMSPAARAGYPHRHAFYQILHVTGGSGSHIVDFTPLPVRPPCLYFLTPGQVHFWRLEEPLEGRVILFSPDFLILQPPGGSLLDDLSFFHSVDGASSLPMDSAAARRFAGLVDSLEEAFLNPDFAWASVVRAYLHILLVEVQRRYPRGPAGRREQRAQSLVRRFKKLVSEQFLTERSVAAYASALGITAGHLSDTIRAATSRTAGQVIRAEVTTEAKRLLAHSDLGVAEIAYRLRFDDPAYFGRFFRRETGLTPGALRSEFREKYQINR